MNAPNPLMNNYGQVKGIMKKNKNSLNTFEEMNNNAKLNENAKRESLNSSRGFNNTNPFGNYSFNSSNQLTGGYISNPIMYNTNPTVSQSYPIMNSYPIANPSYNPMMSNGGYFSQPFVNNFGSMPSTQAPNLVYANSPYGNTIVSSRGATRPQVLTTVQSLDMNSLILENQSLKKKLNEMDRNSFDEAIDDKKHVKFDFSKPNQVETPDSLKQRKSNQIGLPDSQKERKSNQIGSPNSQKERKSNQIGSPDPQNERKSNQINSIDPFKNSKERQFQSLNSFTKSDLNISEIKLDDQVIMISRDSVPSHSSSLNENVKHPKWFDEMYNAKIAKDDKKFHDERANFIESFKNDAKARMLKNQEIQTEDNDELNKTFPAVSKSNSKGIQVDESDKTTLSQMRFDLFKKNVHLSENRDTSLDKDELKKESNKNKTFWDYINNNKKGDDVKDKKFARSSRLDNSKDDHDDEFLKYLNTKDSAKSEFTWQIDEFKK